MPMQTSQERQYQLSMLSPGMLLARETSLWNGQGTHVGSLFMFCQLRIVRTMQQAAVLVGSQVSEEWI